MTELLSISLISTFIIQFISVVGIREWLQIHSNKFFNKLLNCDFCLSFWVNLFVSLCYITYTKDYSIWYYFIIATPITKKLL